MSWSDYLNASLLMVSADYITERHLSTTLYKNVLMNDNIENLLSDLIPGLLSNDVESKENLMMWYNLYLSDVLHSHVSLLQIKSFCKNVIRKRKEDQIQLWKILHEVLCKKVLIQFLTNSQLKGYAYVPLLYCKEYNDIIPDCLRYNTFRKFFDTLIEDKEVIEEWCKVLEYVDKEFSSVYDKLVSDLIKINESRAQVVANETEATDETFYNITQILIEKAIREGKDSNIESTLKVMYLAYPLLVLNIVAMGSSSDPLASLLSFVNLSLPTDNKVRYEELKERVIEDKRVYTFINSVLERPEKWNKHFYDVVAKIVFMHIYTKRTEPFLSDKILDAIEVFLKNPSTLSPPHEVFPLLMYVHILITNDFSDNTRILRIILQSIEIMNVYKSDKQVRMYLNRMYDALYYLIKKAPKVIGLEMKKESDKIEKVLSNLLEDLNKYDYSVNLIHVILQNYHVQEEFLIIQMVQLFIGKTLLQQDRYIEKSFLLKRLLTDYEDLFIFELIIKTNDPLTVLDSWRANPFFEQLVDLNLLRKKIQKELEVRNLTDIPERFQDALTGELMRNPVKLPNSGQVVDKSSILIHLSQHDDDPFTRTKLSRDELIVLTDLKQEIMDFISKKEYKS
jgi:hypothetical protein